MPKNKKILILNKKFINKKNKKQNKRLLEDFYKKFLDNALKITKKMVVIFPNFVNYKKLMKKWKIKKSFDYYIHKSLTKKIVILAQ